MSPSPIRRRPRASRTSPPVLGRGERFGAYVIREFAGSGATSHVYRARHCDSLEPVALKIVHPYLLSQPGKHERFMREARMMMRLRHRNIVRFDQVLEGPEGLAFVMEYIGGETLWQWQKAWGELDEFDLACVFIDLLRGLHHAHRQGIVHRDLKPANILISQAEGRYTAKIIDFGVARHLDEPLLQDDTTKIIGTAAYISPEEVADPHTVCPSSDLYSVGVMLYEAACGQRPFQGLPISELMDAHRLSAPVSPREFNPELSPAFESVIMRTLEKTTAHRFGAAPQMMRALELAIQGIDTPLQGKGAAAAPRPASALQPLLSSAPALKPSPAAKRWFRRVIGGALHLASSTGARSHGVRDPHYLHRQGPGWPL